MMIEDCKVGMLVLADGSHFKNKVAVDKFICDFPFGVAKIKSIGSESVFLSSKSCVYALIPKHLTSLEQKD